MHDSKASSSKNKEPRIQYRDNHRQVGIPADEGEVWWLNADLFARKSFDVHLTKVLGIGGNGTAVRVRIHHHHHHHNSNGSNAEAKTKSKSKRPKTGVLRIGREDKVALRMAKYAGKCGFGPRVYATWRGTVHAYQGSVFLKKRSVDFLLMEAGDMNLHRYFKLYGTESFDHDAWTQLGTVLTRMADAQLQHNDLKPDNIIVKLARKNRTQQKGPAAAAATEEEEAEKNRAKMMKFRIKRILVIDFEMATCLHVKGAHVNDNAHLAWRRVVPPNAFDARYDRFCFASYLKQYSEPKIFQHFTKHFGSSFNEWSVNHWPGLQYIPTSASASSTLVSMDSSRSHSRLQSTQGIRKTKTKRA